MKESVMSRKAGIVALLAVCSIMAGTAQGAIIEFQSDETVMVQPLPFGGLKVLTEDDFNLKWFSPAAVLNAPHPAWIAALPNPMAKWLGVTRLDGTPSGPGIPIAWTGLYMIKVYNDGMPTTGGSIDLVYSMDDYLEGVYLNGQKITPESGDLVSPRSGEFLAVHSLTFSGLEFAHGWNYIYLHAVNVEGPGGAIFSGTVTIPYVEIPEPMSMSLLTLGAAALLVRRKR
jgi:hypothetical protein